MQSLRGCAPKAGAFSAVPSPRTACAHSPRRAVLAPVRAMPMKDVIEKLIARNDLTAQQAEEALTTMLSDFVPEQAAAFLVLLRAKVRMPCCATLAVHGNSS